MKRLLALTSAGLLLFCISGFAQVNTDSLTIVAKISKYQLELGKLQNTIAKKTNTKQNDSLIAQQSANANATAANNLSANPQDKKDARQADNAASTAKGDSRRARKAADKLNDLNRNILDLQNKIADQQSKLNQFTHLTYAIVAPPVTAQADTTTQHQ
jgi:cell division protein FtsL